MPSLPSAEFFRSHFSIPVCLAIAALAFATTPVNAADPAASALDARDIEIQNRPDKSDFNEMVKRHYIRVVVPYSRTLFYIDKGQEKGLSAELVRDFEQYINKKYKKERGKRPITVVIAATSRDKLMSQVHDGMADIAAAALTVTEERTKYVDIVAQKSNPPVREVLVTGPKSPKITTIDDLSGQTVFVRKSSSYYQSLQTLNARFKASGKTPVTLTLLPDELEDEDMMEMVETGILGLIVVDDWKAKMWAPVLPGIVVRKDIVLRDNGRIGWAIRKGSPELTAVIEDFYKNWVAKQGVTAYRLKRDSKRIAKLKDPTISEERKRLQVTLELFKKYGAQYGFDPLVLAAQGYQESRLDQNVKSRVGAIGVMQLMPATGAAMKVGDVTKLEPNIHAAAKYMDHLMEQYFDGAHFDKFNRSLFALAAYNCGPGNVSKFRKLAEQRGFDPNIWTNNVEVIAAEKLGSETTTYVRNIYKYYVAYRLILDAQARSDAAKKNYKAAQ